jgi:hypothetical protein
VITFQEAREIALRYIADMETQARNKAKDSAEYFNAGHRGIHFKPEVMVLKLALLEDNTIEDEFGWVFFYESEDYIKSGSYREMLLGNAPLMISRQDGHLHVTGTAHPVEFYIENFKRSGDPDGQQPR